MKATPRLKRALAEAVRLAETNGDKYLGVDHLLYGIAFSEPAVLELAFRKALESKNYPSFAHVMRRTIIEVLEPRVRVSDDNTEDQQRSDGGAESVESAG